MITKAQIDELVALRSKYIETGDAKYRDECLRKAAYRAIPEPLIVDYLDEILDEKFFRAELGYPEINLRDKLDEMLEYKITRGVIQPGRARNLTSMLSHLIAYFEKEGVHPFDIGERELLAFIREHEKVRGKELGIEDYRLDPNPWGKALQSFFSYIESTDPTFIYNPALRRMSTAVRKEERRKDYFRVFIASPKPKVPSFQVGVREFPDSGWVQVSETVWFYSEMNLVYNTLYENYKLFNDWERLEILFRVKRETGLRQEHAKYLQWRDILYEDKEPLVIYDRLEELSIVKGKKYLPTIPTPISPLLVKRIKTYRDTHKKAPYNEPEDSNLFQLTFTPVVFKPTEEYQDFGRLRYFARVTERIREVGGFQFCKEQLPDITLCPFCGKMFRWSLGTLYVNIIPDMGKIEQLFGDEYKTIKVYYAKAGLKAYYEGIGLRSHEDIITKIFSNEGMRAGDKPYAKKKVGRKPKGFEVVEIFPERIEEFHFLRE